MKRKRKTRQSGFTSNWTGKSSGARHWLSIRRSATATAQPATPPAMEIHKDSVSNCRTMRPRPAPIEIRIARSRTRSAARAASSAARFVHAANKTRNASSITPPPKARVGSRTIDPTSPGAGNVSRMPSLLGYSRASCAATAWRLASACSTATPAFSRPADQALKQRLHSSHEESSIWACIVIGTQTSAQMKTSVPWNPRGATPNTVYGRPLMRTSFPATLGSPPKRFCQHV